MDLLDDILSTLELSSTLYFRAELTAPFSMSVPGEGQIIRFHIAIGGSCWIGLPNGDNTVFHSGDLIFVPHGSAYLLADSPDTATTPLAEIMKSHCFDGAGLLRYGGGGASATLICGYFDFAHPALHPIITSLPSLVHVESVRARQFVWVEQILAFMCEESRMQMESWRQIVRRLSEVIFIYVLREYMRIAPHKIGALAAITDPALGAALRAIHADPGQDWTIEKMAKMANTSRSVFAELFKANLGITPAKYLLMWRMQKASAMLERNRNNVAEVAERVGYASEAAFSRAFKEQFGVSPGQYRRGHR